MVRIPVMRPKVGYAELAYIEVECICFSVLTHHSDNALITQQHLSYCPFGLFLSKTAVEQHKIAMTLLGWTCDCQECDRDQEERDFVRHLVQSPDREGFMLEHMGDFPPPPTIRQIRDADSGARWRMEIERARAHAEYEAIRMQRQRLANAICASVRVTRDPPVLARSPELGVRWV